jgi:hypothetical protein
MRLFEKGGSMFYQKHREGLSNPWLLLLPKESKFEPIVTSQPFPKVNSVEL